MQVLRFLSVQFLPISTDEDPDPEPLCGDLQHIGLQPHWSYWEDRLGRK